LKVRTRVIATVWYLLLVNYLDRVAIGFAAPAIMKSASLSSTSFGLVLSSFGLGYLLAQVPGGLAADRWGAKRILVIAPLFWSLFTAITGLVSTLLGFVIVRIFFGLSEGVLIAAIFKIVGDCFDSKERARALAFCLSAGALGPLIAGPLVGSLLAAYNWHVMFFVLAAPALLASVFSFWALPPTRISTRFESATPSESKRIEHGSLLRILAQSTFWLMALAYLGYNIAFWGYVGWMPSYLARAHHIDLKSMGTLGGIPYAFGFVGLLFEGWLGTGPLHRYHAQMIAVSLACAGLAMFLACRADSLTQALSALCGAAFFLYGCWGSIGAVILDLAPPLYKGTYAGGVSAAGQIGGLIAPAIVGFLVEETGTFVAGFGFMIGAVCISATCMLVLSASRGTTVPGLAPER
jgi:MFS family permease